MKKFICVILALTMLFGLASCSGRGTGKNITYPLYVSPSTLDPQYASETGARVVINNVFEGLVRLNPEGEIIPGIAESWDVSEDGMTYTFHLKPKTEWYCPAALKTEFGEEFYEKFAKEKVTANDFVFACRRTVDPATTSPHAHRLFIIENASEINHKKAKPDTLGVTAQDDYTLVFKLTEPCESFLERLTESEFMPCNEEFFNKTAGRYGVTSKHILCNGPFYVSYWDPETSMTIKSNKYYAGEQSVTPSSVILSFDPDESSVYKKLTNGSLSAAFLAPGSKIPENVKVAKELSNTVTGFFFNCSDENLANPNIRMALCSLIDRSLFPDSSDIYKVQHGIVPERCIVGSASFRERVGKQTAEIKHSRSKAKTFWETGLTELNAKNINLTVLCPQEFDTCVREQLQIWQKEMGMTIKVNIEDTDSKDINEAIENGNYQIAVGSISTEHDNAVDFLSELSEGKYFRLKTEEYSKIVDEISKAGSDDELLGECFKAESYLLQLGVCYPLYSSSAKFVVSEEVEGISILDSEKSISFISARRFD